MIFRIEKRKIVQRMLALMIIISVVFGSAPQDVLAQASTVVGAPFYNGNLGKTNTYNFTAPPLYFGPHVDIDNDPKDYWSRVSNVSGSVISKGYVQVNGVWVTDGTTPTLNVGDNIVITAGPHQPEQIRWGGTNEYKGFYNNSGEPGELGPQIGVANFNNLYGWWMDEAATTNAVSGSNPIRFINDSPFHMNNYVYRNDWAGFEGYSTDQERMHGQYLGFLQIYPRTHTLLTSGTAGVNCGDPYDVGTAIYGSYKARACTITSPGTLQVTVRHESTTGRFYGSLREAPEGRMENLSNYFDPANTWQLLPDWVGFPIPNTTTKIERMTDEYLTCTNTGSPSFQTVCPPSANYTLNVPTTDVNFNFTVVNPCIDEEIGLRIRESSGTVVIAGSSDLSQSKLHIATSGGVRSVLLVDPTDANASKMKIRLGDGTTKALKKKSC